MFEHHLSIDEAVANNPYHHVHHADIVRLFEQGRLAFLDSIGFSNDSFVARNIYPVVASVTVRFLREVRPGRHTVSCEGGRRVGRSLFVCQRLRNDRGKLLAEAEVECVLMDGTSRRAITPEEQFEKAFTMAGRPS